MGLSLSKEEAKALLEQLLSEPELRAYLQVQLAQEFALRSSTESHLERLYQEILRDREEEDRRWTDIVAELRQQREEFERRWQAQEAARKTEWEEYRATLRAEWEEYKATMRAEWEAYLTTMRNEWEEYKAAMHKEWEEYKAAMRAEWEAYLTTMRNEWEEYKATMHKEWEEYKAAMRTEWEEYKAAMRAETQAMLQRFEAEMKVLHEKLEKTEKRLDSTIGALGARWGIYAESAFREGMKAILETDFGVKVKRYITIDTEGKVFNRPDQIELDLIIYDGKLILAEIKSALHRGDVHLFLNKVALFIEKEKKTPDRLMIISPFVHSSARELAEQHNIEIHTVAPEKLE